MTIWKYTLDPKDLEIIGMPAGARILTVQVQAGQPCLWAQVEPGNPIVGRSLRTYGTGQPMPDSPGSYVGSYQLRGGSIVFHVFEVN